MIKCEKCGAQMPDNAKFCPKCGAPIANHSQEAQPAPVAQQAADKPAVKASGASAFAKMFWVLFVSTGVAAYLLLSLSSTFLAISLGFGVTLAVFSLLTAGGFMAIGIANKALSMGAQEKTKHAVRDNVCLSVSIILFVFVLMSCIAIFVVASRVY